VARALTAWAYGASSKQNGVGRSNAGGLATMKPPKPPAPMAIPPTLLVHSYPLRKTGPPCRERGPPVLEEKPKHRWIGHPLGL
jgi:hypothetical protein